MFPAATAVTIEAAIDAVIFVCHHTITLTLPNDKWKSLYSNERRFRVNSNLTLLDVNTRKQAFPHRNELKRKLVFLAHFSINRISSTSTLSIYSVTIKQKNKWFVALREKMRINRWTFLLITWLSVMNVKKQPENVKKKICTDEVFPRMYVCDDGYFIFYWLQSEMLQLFFFLLVYLWTLF